MRVQGGEVALVQGYVRINWKHLGMSKRSVRAGFPLLLPPQNHLTLFYKSMPPHSTPSWTFLPHLHYLLQNATVLGLEVVAEWQSQLRGTERERVLHDSPLTPGTDALFTP